ncbi:copper chaperone PCu(A)C [Pelagerythrobacter rhizovicinus]|uniref:Copper chaperone PCu(A)C n=1 Tax=Pelagerythrobacter rhizovicinus TaxID=2268576 RepID=A0A4Q2KGI6_9SPHN|nr:copper chaperone PCu(A)C [Pelagerythrobacter rhizovicinus]RXZ64184.1 copper chaperone PCu(A)C [Pelagerythrobacter rhizovicinus]
MTVIPRCPQGQPKAALAAGPRRVANALVAALALALPLSACGSAPDADTRTDATASRTTVERAWSRETAPGQDAGGAFLTIVNPGSAPDRLIGGKASIAGDVQVHTVDMTDGVMRMRQLAEGLEIPAGGTVTLAPGGYHIMLMDLQRPLTRGDAVPLTLEFEKAGRIEVNLAVQPIGAAGPGEAHHD